MSGRAARTRDRDDRPLREHRSGQALVEFALVFPLFLMLLFSIISFGLYVFYNQQLANAAREAARYAAVHSSTSQCPTVSRLDPPLDLRPDSTSYFRCDAPENGWPRMTEAARSKIWGMAPNQVSLTACWSGYVDAANNFDAHPTSPNVTFSDCTMNRVDPRTDSASLPCPAPATIPTALNPAKADGDDKASDLAAAPGQGDAAYPTTVTVYTCFIWKPPMAGFVIIPSQITIRAVITESLQRQQ
jgi:TadE-like protein